MQSDEADTGTEKELSLFVQDENTSGEISSSDENSEKESNGFVQQDSGTTTPSTDELVDATEKDSTLSSFVQSDAEMQSDEADAGTEKEQNLFVQDDNTSGEISSSDEDSEKESNSFVQQDSGTTTPSTYELVDATVKDSALSSFLQDQPEIQTDEADAGTEKELNLFVQDDNTSGEISSSDEDNEKESNGFLQLIN